MNILTLLKKRNKPEELPEKPVVYSDIVNSIHKHVLSAFDSKTILTKQEIESIISILEIAYELKNKKD